MIGAIYVLLGLIFLTIALVFVFILVRYITADRSILSDSRARSGNSLKNAITGNLSIASTGEIGAQQGIGIKNNEWLRQARISDASVDAILKRCI